MVNHVICVPWIRLFRSPCTRVTQAHWDSGSFELGVNPVSEPKDLVRAVQDLGNLSFGRSSELSELTF